jgi:hypothetical protein
VAGRKEGDIARVTLDFGPGGHQDHEDTGDVLLQKHGIPTPTPAALHGEGLAAAIVRILILGKFEFPLKLRFAIQLLP